MQVLAVNGDDIKVFGRIRRTMQIEDKLHRHMFLVTALTRPLLGWHFLCAHHAHIKAAPEAVHFQCKCPPPACSAGPMRVLSRWPHVCPPMRRLQQKRRSTVHSSSSLNKTQRTGLMHSDFWDPQLQEDQYKKSGRNRSSDHLLLLSRNLSTTGLRATYYLQGPLATDDTSSTPTGMQQMHAPLRHDTRRLSVQVPPADNYTFSRGN